MRRLFSFLCQRERALLGPQRVSAKLFKFYCLKPLRGNLEYGQRGPAYWFRLCVHLIVFHNAAGVRLSSVIYVREKVHGCWAEPKHSRAGSRCGLM